MGARTPHRLGWYSGSFTNPTGAITLRFASRAATDLTWKAGGMRPGSPSKRFHGFRITKEASRPSTQLIAGIKRQRRTVDIESLTADEHRPLSSGSIWLGDALILGSPCSGTATGKLESRAR